MFVRPNPLHGRDIGLPWLIVWHNRTKVWRAGERSESPDTGTSGAVENSRIQERSLGSCEELCKGLSLAAGGLLPVLDV
jgi:hypothetical protein